MDIVPLIDLTPWFGGGSAERSAVAAAADEGLRTSGFILVTGHGVPMGLRTAARTAAKEFFALPTDTKAAYIGQANGQGWVKQGEEITARLEGSETLPDLKESYLLHPETPTGDPTIDEEWFRPNVYPTEIPELGPVIKEYVRQVNALSNTLMSICAVALGRSPDFFQPYLTHPTNNFAMIWYPPLTQVGQPSTGQFRTGPHTDWGTITVLDRQPGVGGLQVYVDQQWEDVPFYPHALTINTGELLARWTGNRWAATRHRVLPPSPTAPHEELLSMVLFGATSPDAVISPLTPDIGPTSYPPVAWADHYRHQVAKMAAGDQ